MKLFPLLGIGILLMAAIVTADGLMTYFDGSSTLGYRTWTSTNSTNLSGITLSGNAEWIRLTASPTRSQYLAGAIYDTGSKGVIAVASYESSWSAVTNLTTTIGTTNDQYRGLGLTYLSDGRALAVFNNNTANASYALWNGSTWTQFGNLPSDNCTDTTIWIELVAGPNGTAYEADMDNSADFCAHVWDGSAWTATRTLQTTTTTKATKRFAIAAEGISGDALVVWQSVTAGVMQACAYDADNSSGWCNSIMSLNDVGAASNWINLASHNSSDRIMLTGFEQAADDVDAIEWNGTVFANANTPVLIDGTTEIGGTNNVQAAYWNDGVVLVYDNANEDGPSYVECKNATACGTGNWTAVASTGLANCGEASDLEFVDLAAGPSALMFYGTSQTSHDKCIQEWNGTWQTGKTLIGQGKSQIDALDFVFAYAKYGSTAVADTTPPVFDSMSSISAEATSSGGATVSYTAPNATDAVDGARPVSCTPASGSTFAIGTSTVSCSASDLSNNTATTNFTITVSDTTAPSITLTSPIATIYTSWTILLNRTVTDVVGIASVVYSYTDTLGNSSGWSDFSSAILRDFSDNSTVTLTALANDTYGNTATAIVTFSINASAAPDTINPTISDVITDATNDTISISWITDESANSTVDYGLDANMGDIAASGSLVTTHSITLTGLQNNTAYYFNLTSCDLAGNCGRQGTDIMTTEQNDGPPIIAPAEPAHTGSKSKKKSLESKPEAAPEPEPEAPVEVTTTETVVSIPAASPTLTLDPIVNETEPTAITALATSPLPFDNTASTVIGILLAVAALIATFIYLRRPRAEIVEGTKILAERADEPLIPYHLLLDADTVLDQALEGKAMTWNALAKKYPPIVVNVCKRAVKEAKKEKGVSVTLEGSYDYIGYPTFVSFVHALASAKIHGASTMLADAPHQHHEIGIDSKDLVFIKKLKISTPEDVNQVLDVLRHGPGLLLLDVSGMENVEQLKSALKKIKRTADVNHGGVLGLGTTGILATNSIEITKHGGDNDGVD